LNAKSTMVETMEICPKCKGTKWDETRPGVTSRCTNCEDGWVKTKVSLKDIYEMIKVIDRHTDDDGTNYDADCYCVGYCDCDKESK
jgi:hypothetical protein